MLAGGARGFGKGDGALEQGKVDRAKLGVGHG